MTYDLDKIEEKFKSAKKTEDWAEAFVNELTMVFNAVEGYLQCTICSKSMGKSENDPALLILPCQHSFCKGCHKSKTRKIGDCSRCNQKE
jgi:hypothetical protein